MVDHDYTHRLFTSRRDIGVGTRSTIRHRLASMSYLRTLPFDKLKIDRKFVTNVHRVPRNQAIRGALIGLWKGTACWRV